MQFNLKWKAEFNRIDEVCIKPLPFDYRKTKYNSDSILRYVEIANAHHHKWGYPKMKKCAATLMVSMQSFSLPATFAGGIGILPIFYYTIWWLFMPLFIEEQRAILLPALLQSMALLLFPFIATECNQYVSKRLNINLEEYPMSDNPMSFDWGLVILSFAFGVWFAGRAFFATMGLLTPLLNM